MGEEELWLGKVGGVRREICCRGWGGVRGEGGGFRKVWKRMMEEWYGR